MSVYKSFVRNTIWMAFGQGGVTLISFFLLPMYTYYLDPKSFGLIDILQVTSLLFLPIITLQTGDAIQTFLLKREKKREVVFTNALLIFVGIWSLSWLTFPIFKLVFKEYTIVFFMLMLFQGFSSLCFPYYKGIDKVKTSSIISIVESITLLITMIIMIVYFKAGIGGYFIALLLARFSSFIIFLFSLPLWKLINLSSISKQNLVAIIIFSIPLIPNMLGWWLTNVSDRYLVNYFMGMKYNGIYAIAAKIPSILNIISSIFISSWMITALQNYNEKNGRKFFIMGKIFSLVMILISLIIITFNNEIFSIFVRNIKYNQAKTLIPLLVLSSFLSAISSLFGITYLGENNTKMAAITTFSAGIINIILNIILIPIIGLLGAVWATFISYLVIVALRYLYIKSKTSIRMSTNSIVIISIITLLILLNNIGFKIESVLQVVSFVLLLFTSIELFWHIKKNNLLRLS